MANFYITGVWKTQTGRITHVMLHSINQDNAWNRGVKTSEQTVIGYINQGHIVRTAMWNYGAGNWSIGAIVLVVAEGNGYILRTTRDHTVRDNLDNIIRMEYFIQ